MQRTAERTLSPSDMKFGGCGPSDAAELLNAPHDLPDSATMLAVRVAEAETDIRRIKTGIGLMILAFTVISGCVMALGWRQW